MILLYLAAGAFAGLLAGLFGVGGGLVIVPVLSFIFAAEGFPEAQILHLALGTSLASILFTGFVSARAHDRRGAVNWRVLKGVTPGVLIGTFAGSALAAHLHSRPLAIFFIVFEFYVATQMLLGFRPRPERQLPGLWGLTLAGLVIGVVSSLVGIGGGTLSVPFLSWSNVSLPVAIGTSAAIGLPIALAGALGYALNGLGTAGLPDYSIGFVYLPALLGLVLASMLTAPLGARLAHRLPVLHLKRLFALLLYLLAIRMAFELF
ncbi:sulfite exporter TauE/SafE family protein [Thermithiobacillus plumbiphilus]|uniref:Probable membrane transporter protein n=1 Tax=Thermithiobacillus plumbiphilus TaxID=1729899 RepID=A0ABU9D7M4_9PROT